MSTINRCVKAGESEQPDVVGPLILRWGRQLMTNVFINRFFCQPQGKLDELVEVSRKSLAIGERSLPPDDPKLGILLNDLAWSCLLYTS